MADGSGYETRLGCGRAIMAAGGSTQYGAQHTGRFHLKCSSAVQLSTDRTTAWTTRASNFGVVFSSGFIPTGQKFSVKVLKPAVVSSSSAYYTPPVRP